MSRPPMTKHNSFLPVQISDTIDDIGLKMPVNPNSKSITLFDSLFLDFLTIKINLGGPQNP